MGLFDDPYDGKEVTNTNGTKFRYVATDNKWIIVNAIIVSNLVYNEGNWDTNLDVPTKNVIRDKIVSMDSLIVANTTVAEVDGIVLTHKNLPNAHHNESHALDSHTIPTGSIAMSSQKFTGLSAGTTAGDSVRYEQLHTRLHAITDILDHSASNHKVFYSDGNGHIIELGLGADGEVLTSNGPTVAPSFQADAGGDNLGNHIATTTLNINNQLIDNVVHIQGNGIVYVAPYNDTDDELCISTVGNNLRIYQEGATTAAEVGFLGHSETYTTRPWFAIYSHTVYNDDGTIEEYSIVDDLQLLRDVKRWDVRKKVVNPKFPEFKQHVFDVNTLPWVKAHPNVNAIAFDDNEKRYSSTVNQKVGYLLSTMQKMLEKIDELESRIISLEK